jgi:hypothetical protein
MTSLNISLGQIIKSFFCIAVGLTSTLGITLLVGGVITATGLAISLTKYKYLSFPLTALGISTGAILGIVYAAGPLFLGPLISAERGSIGLRETLAMSKYLASNQKWMTTIAALWLPTLTALTLGILININAPAIPSGSLIGCILALGIPLSTHSLALNYRRTAYLRLRNQNTDHQ